MRTVLVAINAKYSHKALAPWCLKAYCEAPVLGRPLESVTILEYSINENIRGMLAGIDAIDPDVVGFSCYIWNREVLERLLPLLRMLRPACKIVLGGPEVSFEETPLTGITALADRVIAGEGEQAFYEYLTGEPQTALPFCELPTPFTQAYFDSFTAQKPIIHQLIYYESSRGCPFSCSYCLSSATKGISYLSIDRVKRELLQLVEQGARCIKFVDRTFNAHPKRALEILQFVGGLDTSCVFHFEVAADLFDEALLTYIPSLPVGRVQFEVGLQSVYPPTLEAVCRKTDIPLVKENLNRLIAPQNCHIHLDLIAGLPLETLESFREAINMGLEVRPHMLQLGFLKMLKGCAIRRDSDAHGYLYSPHPPYEILQSDTMSFQTLTRLKGIEDMVDTYYNAGVFSRSLDYGMTLFSDGFGFYDALFSFAKSAGVTRQSLKNAYTLLYRFLCHHGDQPQAAHVIKLDCLTYDPKAITPDEIRTNRQKSVETMAVATARAAGKRCSRVRGEYFEFDQRMRLFCYDEQHPVTKAFKVTELPKEVGENE